MAGQERAFHCILGRGIVAHLRSQRKRRRKPSFYAKGNVLLLTFRLALQSRKRKPCDMRWALVVCTLTIELITQLLACMTRMHGQN